MKDVAVVVLVALLSVVLTELVAVALMSAMPPSFDANSNFFVLIVPLSVALVVGLGLLAIGKRLARVSLGVALLYAGVFAAAQFAMLAAFFNPLGDRLVYLGITASLTLLGTWWMRSRHAANADH